MINCNTVSFLLDDNIICNFFGAGFKTFSGHMYLVINGLLSLFLETEVIKNNNELLKKHLGMSAFYKSLKIFFFKLMVLQMKKPK